MGLLILTTIGSIGLFALTFLNMIKKNYSNYLYLLITEFIGIFIDFIFIISGNIPNVFGYAVIFILSIILPIVSFLLEKKGIYLSETFSVGYIKIFKKENSETLIKLCERYPNSYQFHKMLANFYVKNNEKEKAEDEYLKVIELKENDYKTYCVLAQILAENDKRNQAQILLQRLLSIKPDYTEGSVLLGNMLYESQNFKEAVNVFNQAIKYNPSEYNLYYFLGMTYTRLNDFQGAKDNYKKAAQLNSIKDPANLNLGQIYMLFKEYENAEKYFYETIKSDDERVGAYSYYYLAKIRLIQGEKEQVIQYANVAIDMYPKMKKIMEKDDLFIPILAKLISKDEKETETKLNKKELEIVKYLGTTFNKVETLTNDVQIKQKDDREIEK